MESSPEKISNGNSSSKKLTNYRKTVEISDGKKMKPYRLTIKIDKIYLRPCPKSKKKNQITINIDCTQKAAEERPQNLKCLVCEKEFTSTSEMYKHVNEHFVCDICDTEFSSQKSIKKHIKIHLSENSKQPYKCHVCEKLFDTKEAIKGHSHIKLDQYNNDNDDSRVQYCNTCNKSFKSETAFRKHLVLHVDKVSEVPVSNQKMTRSNMPTFGQLRPVLFNCRICNHNFTNLADIDKHTKTHMKELESL